MAVLAIDLEGGDYGPSRLIPASIEYLARNPRHSAILYGREDTCLPLLPSLPDNLRFQSVSSSLSPALNPAQLLRHEYGSSIEDAYRALANKEVDALISSEHTGILMALSHRHSVTHPAVDRPVLVSWVPTAREPILMLDLGASFSATAEQLLGFSAIGLAIANSSRTRRPRLALLNLGVEANKGPQSLRLGAEQLKQWSDVDFKGFIEANEVFQGDLDLVITDGFTGNAVIKAAEGTLDLTLSAIRGELERDWLGRLLGRLLSRRLKPHFKKLDPRRSNGALLAGTPLTVIKSHGHADGVAFQAALARAVEAAEGRWCPLILERLDKLLI